MAPRERQARWRLITVDLALLGFAYFVYSLVRNAVPGERSAALRRGSDLLRGEQLTGLDPEHGLNQALAAHPVLANVADYYYATMHFVVVLGVLGWLYWRHLESARRWVYAWLVMNLLALLGFWLLPTAPPRLLPGAGFVDTVVQFHTWGSWADKGVASAANQFAAFPSLHVGWALWSALTINALARRRWVGRIAFAYPLVTALVVLSTANHYLLDVFAGILVCLLSFPVSHAAVRLIARAHERLGRSAAPVPVRVAAAPEWWQWWKGWRRKELLTAAGLVITLVASVSTGFVVVARRRLEAADRRGATNIAERFIAAWSSGSYEEMARLTGDSQAQLAAVYRTSKNALRESAGTYELRSVWTGSRPGADFIAHVTVAGYGTWSYQGMLRLADRRGHWSVNWSPSALYPGLQSGERLALLTSPVAAGHLLDDTGMRIRGADAELTSSILGPATGTGNTTTGGLHAQLAGELAGRPAGTIAIVGARSQPRQWLHRFPVDSGENVRTTLDLQLQRLAEQVVDTSSLPTSLVAVDTRTGAVKASAGNPAAGDTAAMDGRFPPGSTFKIVTATAALENGYTLATNVNCPATIDGGGFTFHNASHEVLGNISFERAFAVSCNTAFVGIAESLPQGALAKAAEFYGCTVRSPTARQQQPLEIPSFACNYPPSSGAEYAASAFGQAAVEVSPLGMTTICAAAETGVWHSPTLLAAGAPGSTTLPVRRLPANISAQLRTAMRAVVTSGTATAIASTPIAGKTGTAEYGTGNPLPTHAWFTGYLGHYAVTVLVQDGGFGGSVAAPLAARFLTQAQSADAAAGLPA